MCGNFPPLGKLTPNVVNADGVGVGPHNGSEFNGRKDLCGPCSLGMVPFQ